jgi:hypothetical protein
VQTCYAKSVARFLGPPAIGIEDINSTICTFIAIQIQEPVGADTGMPIT